MLRSRRRFTRSSYLCNCDYQKSVGGWPNSDSNTKHRLLAESQRTGIFRRGVSIAEFVLVLAIIASTVGAIWTWQECSLGGASTDVNRQRDTAIGGLYSVSISPDQKRILTIGLGGIMRTHVLDTQECVDEFDTEFGDSRCAVYSPDGRQLMIGTVLGHFQIWNFDSSQSRAHTVKGHDHEVLCGAFSPNCKSLVTSARDGMMKAWDVETLKPIWSIQNSTGAIRAMTFSGDKKQLLTGDSEGFVKSWDLAAGTLLLTLRVSQSDSWEQMMFVTVECLPKSDDILVATRGEPIQIWNLKTQKCKRKFGAPRARYRTVVLSADGKTVISGGTDGEIAVWDLETGERRKSWAAHSLAVLDIACLNDNSRLVSVGWDGMVRVWDL
jgi:WD40 repeat protein